jgi:hypothetical protein
MRIAFGADDENECTRAVVDYLREAGELQVLSSGSWPEFARGDRDPDGHTSNGEVLDHDPFQRPAASSAATRTARVPAAGSRCRAVPLRSRTDDTSPPSRLVSWASAPEFGELPGKGSALAVTGSSGGRTRRRIHQIGAECVAGVAIREDGFDSAAACA